MHQSCLTHKFGNMTWMSGPHPKNLAARHCPKVFLPILCCLSCFWVGAYIADLLTGKIPVINHRTLTDTNPLISVTWRPIFVLSTTWFVKINSLLFYNLRGWWQNRDLLRSELVIEIWGGKIGDRSNMNHCAIMTMLHKNCRSKFPMYSLI